MGFLILKSKNKMMSYVINKNPNTSPHLKEIRKGVCIGYFFNQQDQRDQRNQQDQDQYQQYITRFVDINENVSFPRNQNSAQYDYLSYKKYCAPILMTCIVKEMFGTIINKSSEHDVKNECSIEQGLMKLSGKAVKLINKLNTYIKQYSIKLVKTNVTGLYKFTLSSNLSYISDLLQYAYILGFTLNCLTFGYTEKPDSSALDKIIKIMNNINAPYYIDRKSVV